MSQGFQNKESEKRMMKNYGSFQFLPRNAAQKYVQYKNTYTHEVK